MGARGDHAEFAGFVRRILRAYSRRVQAADPEDLAELLELRAAVDEAIDRAARGMHAAGFSWSEIAAATGTTRQAAWKRWASTPGLQQNAEPEAPGTDAQPSPREGL